MILTYNFGKGDVEYEPDYDKVTKKVLSLLTRDMLDSYCSENKITDKEKIAKAKDIITFTFSHYDFGIDEFAEWVEHYRGELEDYFYSDAYDDYLHNEG